jgi:hypothetical protein
MVRGYRNQIRAKEGELITLKNKRYMLIDAVEDMQYSLTV